MQKRQFLGQNNRKITENLNLRLLDENLAVNLLEIFSVYKKSNSQRKKGHF
jgi:hypothetical protein